MRFHLQCCHLTAMSKLQTPSSNSKQKSTESKSCRLNPILLCQKTNKLKGIVFIIFSILDPSLL